MLGVEEKPVYTNRDMIAKMHLEHALPKDQRKNFAGLLENPAMVFESDTRPGRFVVVTDVVVGGQPLLITVESKPAATPQGHQGPVQLVVTVFAKTTGSLPPLGVLSGSGHLLYADKQKVRLIWQNIGDTPRALSPTNETNKVLTGKNLAGYRKTQGAEQDPAMSLSQPVKGMTKADAQSVVSSITNRWANAPEVVVVQNMNDPGVPSAVRKEDTNQRSQGASGEPEGFFYDGKAYIVASALKSPGDVMRVLLHETLLRGTFWQ
jgi:hypothetical protein